jgi:hypothetical protein
VTAVTREEGGSDMPSGVNIKKVNYDEPSTLVKALEGTEVLIITMSVMAPRDMQFKLITAAAEANVPWVIPNEWGCDSANSEMFQDIVIGQAILAARKQIESLGKSNWTSILCGFWYEYSLSTSPVMYGFDFKNRAVTLYDDGNTNINTSTWQQCGRAVASLLSLPFESTSGPSLSQFKNKPVYISSFNVSQRDMLASVLRVTSTKESDWTITYEPSAKRFKDGQEQFAKGDRIGFGKLLYARVFYPDESGDFEKRHGLQNELLGLPKEDIDESTKVAIKMAEQGSPFGQH